MRYVQKQKLTKKGFENFQKELNNLKEVRKGAVKNLTQARELGDLSENGFYKAARSELRRIDSRLSFLSYLLKTAQVIESSTKEFASVGSEVCVSNYEKIQNFFIVGSYEADPLVNKISEFSPLGKALIGKQVGDRIEIHTPRGLKRYEIIEIK